MADEYSIDVNLDDVDDGTEPVPEGVRICIVHSVLRKMPKSGGPNPFFEIQLKPVDFPNKILWLNLSTHPKALFNIKLFAKATGLPMQGLNIKDALGKRVAVTVKVIPAQNDPDRKVNEVKPPYTAVR